MLGRTLAEGVVDREETVWRRTAAIKSSAATKLVGSPELPRGYLSSSMSSIIRCLRTARKAVLARSLRPQSRWNSSASRHGSPVEVDECGIPLKPTWSVNELLSSYPKPTIAPATLKKLHSLSALIPPEEGTPEHAKLTAYMENLVKLVEAVKLVDVGQGAISQAGSVPDGRVWAEGTGIKLEREEVPKDDVHGRDLLRYASRTEDGLYVVDADRSR